MIVMAGMFWRPLATLSSLRDTGSNDNFVIVAMLDVLVEGLRPAGRPEGDAGQQQEPDQARKHTKCEDTNDVTGLLSKQMQLSCMEGSFLPHRLSRQLTRSRR